MIILYNPQSTVSRKRILPMSLLALGAILEDRHDYVIVDGNIEPDPLARLDQLVRDGATILGVTVMPGPQLSQAVPLCRELKRRHPGLTIVWGGYFPTQHWEVALRSDFVDYIVRGHGEMIFLNLLDRLKAGGALADIAGLAYKVGGTPKTNIMAPIPHPDRLPDYPYHRVPMDLYAKDCFLGRRTYPHHSSNGCPFFCNFCAVVNMVNGRWLAQSAERTANITRWLHDKWGADAVEFYDNNFFVHESRMVEFSERIMDLGITWWGEARIDTMLKFAPRTWQLMADSGLKMVYLGAESGSDETLKRMNKGGTASAEKTLEIARLLKSYGIIPEFSFVMGNPPDPEGDIRHTIEFIRRVKQYHPEAEVVMYMYTPVPLAGELFEEAKATGFSFPESLEEWTSPAWNNFSQRRSIKMPWMRGDLRDMTHNFERVLNAYYPTSTDPKLRGPMRHLLRAAAAWRYHLKFYDYPLELRALHKIVSYQRPETTGF